MGDNGIAEAIAKRALQKYSALLMSYPNVVGVGLGIIDGRNGKNGNYVVKVYVSKRPAFFRRRIPSKLAIRLPDKSRRVVRVPTVIEEVGRLELEAV